MKSLLLATVALVLSPITALAADLALEGNCAVCLVEAGKVVPGSEKHSASFDRQVYYFPSEAERKMFVANPAKYAPALGGDCVVCRANMGVRMSGKAQFAAIHNGRIYLFPSGKELEAFKAEPKRFENVDVALRGHCSVCIVMAKKWVPGKPEVVSVYDGVRYFFPSAEEKKTFEADPAKFTPALDGDCVVCSKDGGKRIVGSPEFSALHDGRLYLFPDAGAQKQFLANPGSYTGLDVANGGNCIVCAKMAGKQVPGSAEFTSIYKGQRYLFPSAKERQMFDAAPADFVTKNARVGGGPAAGVSVVGKTACAGCAYGVHPITDSDSLGIAVVTADAVYVVEGGEKRFPKLFEARFGGVQVELKGAVKKREGKFVWVEPTSLTAAR
jgi:YHS domain-containing protein